MARAGGENRDIASLQREDPPLVAAEPNAALAARDAEHLMDPGVIMYVVVDAVPPGVSPSVRLKQVFNHGRGVQAVIESDGVTIDNERPPWMIRDETVILK